jgi:hypothetical protein
MYMHQYINHVYYKVDMTEPFVNYCYMPIPMPPAKSNPFTSEKFCGLEQKLSDKSTADFLKQAAGLGLKAAGINSITVCIVVIALVLAIMLARRKAHTTMDIGEPGGTIKADSEAQGKGKKPSRKKTRKAD